MPRRARPPGRRRELQLRSCSSAPAGARACRAGARKPTFGSSVQGGNGTFIAIAYRRNMNRIRLTTAFLVAALSLSSRPALATPPPVECTYAQSRQADDATDALKNWSALHAWYRRWARCDDGGVAEGVSEAVTLLLANHWNTTARLALMGRKDPGFADFVVRHVDETVPDDRLRRIAAHANSACSKGERALCNRIERATR